MIAGALVDTNVLVYAYDRRFPQKQAVAEAWLLRGLETRSACLAHQTLVEFVAAASRPTRQGPAILDEVTVAREVDLLLESFPILYPNEEILRLAVRGRAVYNLAWYDAHMWAYAEHNHATEIWSEDFAGRSSYGAVRIVNPFAAAVPA